MATSFISAKRDLAFNRDNISLSLDLINTMPTRELSFQYVDNRYRAELMIMNKSREKIVLFEIKCKAPNSYQVRPRAGLLNPHAKKKVEIFLCSSDRLSEHANDLFMVRSCEYQGEYIEDEATTVKDAMKETESYKFSFPDKKLRVYFEISDTVDKELAMSRSPLRPLSRLTTAAESEEFGSRSPSPYFKFANENNKIIRRMSYVSRLNTPLNIKDSFEEDSFDLLKGVQSVAPTPSRPESPAKFENMTELTPTKKSSIYLDSRIPNKILKNQARGSVESSPSVKKSVGFGSWGQEQEKPSQFKHQRQPSSFAHVTEEEGTTIVHNVPSVVDTSAYVTKETEIYKRKLHALVKKYYENKKKIKQEEDEMKKMKTEINILKLTGISKKVEDTTVKPSRESYKMELWQFMIVSIAFLILGSALR